MSSCYNNRVRLRWHDWVIVLTILALAVTGVLTIWGDPFASAGPARRGGDGRAVEPAAATRPPSEPRSPGPALGPF